MGENSTYQTLDENIYGTGLNFIFRACLDLTISKTLLVKDNDYYGFFCLFVCLECFFVCFVVCLQSKPDIDMITLL